MGTTGTVGITGTVGRQGTRGTGLSSSNMRGLAEMFGGGLMRPMNGMMGYEGVSGSVSADEVDSNEDAKMPETWEIVDGYQFTGGDPADKESWIATAETRMAATRRQNTPEPWKKYGGKKKKDNALTEYVRKLMGQGGI